MSLLCLLSCWYFVQLLHDVLFFLFKHLVLYINDHMVCHFDSALCSNEDFSYIVAFLFSYTFLLSYGYSKIIHSYLHGFCFLWIWIYHLAAHIHFIIQWNFTESPEQTFSIFSFHFLQYIYCRSVCVLRWQDCVPSSRYIFLSLLVRTYTWCCLPSGCRSSFWFPSGL